MNDVSLFFIGKISNTISIFSLLQLFFCLHTVEFTVQSQRQTPAQKSNAMHPYTTETVCWPFPCSIDLWVNVCGLIAYWQTLVWFIDKRKHHVKPRQNRWWFYSRSTFLQRLRTHLQVSKITNIALLTSLPSLQTIPLKISLILQCFLSHSDVLILPGFIDFTSEQTVSVPNLEPRLIYFICFRLFSTIDSL